MVDLKQILEDRQFIDDVEETTAEMAAMLERSRDEGRVPANIADEITTAIKRSQVQFIAECIGPQRFADAVRVHRRTKTS